MRTKGLTSLTFCGGVNEIGENKILLEDKGTKVFLDFGKGFPGLFITIMINQNHV